MSLYSTTKSGRGSIGYGQNKQSLLLFPGAPAEEDTVLPSRTLAETVKLLNPDVDPDDVIDTLIVQMYGYSSKTLRARYALSPHADLRRAMSIRNRFLYNYFCMAEEGLRLYFEAMIVKQGYMELEEITRHAALVSNSYSKHARGIGKFLNDLVDELGFEVDTGAFFEAEVPGEDDSDEDDIGF